MTVARTHAAAAVTTDVAGHTVAVSFGDPVGEYESLRSGCMLVDRGERQRLTFQGDAAAETLTGLVTNDVGALSPGMGQYAAALTPRGKIIADLRVFARASDLLVDVPAHEAMRADGVLPSLDGVTLERLAEAAGLRAAEAR